jgi:hypothetical protein
MAVATQVKQTERAKMSRMNALSQAKENNAMSNDVTVMNDMPPAGDGWDDEVETSGSPIQGKLLKFGKTGEWTTGKDNTPLPSGLRLVAYNLATAWVRWEGGKPVKDSYIWKTPGIPFPEREDLGYLDEEAWELGPDGKDKRDPWQHTKFVYFADRDTAELYTFSTSAYTHKMPIVDLHKKIQRMRTGRPNAVPFIELDHESYHSPKWGWQIKPLFRMAGWLDNGNGNGNGGGQQLASQEKPPRKQIEPPTPKPAPLAPVNDGPPVDSYDDLPNECDEPLPF